MNDDYYNKKRKKIISTIFIIVLLIFAIIVYHKYDYGFYSKGISERGKTVFSRDSRTTTNKKSSYKIENKDYTDSMFYREISVKKNTAYKVSCMIKTENVLQYQDAQISGAQITLKGTEEHSEIVSGNTDWTKIEFCFNSKNNDTVEIGFRLGANNYKAKGIAWFSDISIVEGSTSSDNTWKFACFVFDNLDVTLDNGKSVSQSISKYELFNINENITRFKETLSALSNNQIQADCNVIEITDPITTVSYDIDNGYYVDEKDVYNLIEKYLQQNEYDHIFLCIKLPDEVNMGENNVINWIGLGNMEYCGKGLSDIRITDDYSTTYQYSNSNTFPEEVFVHEFLHTLERNSSEYGYTVPALHDYAKYGYTQDNKDGLRKWYKDYMNSAIKDDNQYIGISSPIYTDRPIKLSNFKYYEELNLLDEPKNIFEVIKSIIIRVENLFKKTSQEKEVIIVSN